MNDKIRELLATWKSQIDICAQAASKNADAGNSEAAAMWNAKRDTWRSAYETLLETLGDELECESTSCVYNNTGICYFQAVYGRMPRITEEDGCTEGAFPY